MPGATPLSRGGHEVECRPLLHRALSAPAPSPSLRCEADCESESTGEGEGGGEGEREGVRDGWDGEQLYLIEFLVICWTSRDEFADLWVELKRSCHHHQQPCKASGELCMLPQGVSTQATESM